MATSKQMTMITGIVWCGFVGECKDKSPCYIIPRKNADGIFICEVLRKYAGKKVSITIDEQRSYPKQI